jgi:hypothetical protein
MNTNKQGDIGLGAAIAYFTSIGNTVCIPLTDSQDYDLVIDDGSSLKRVQVKRCTFTRRGVPKVSLSTGGWGGGTSKRRIKIFDPSLVDIVVIVTIEKLYVIPSIEIKVKYMIDLGKKYDKFCKT